MQFEKEKLLIFKSVFVPILTHGHESWVTTERVPSQEQASEMRFSRIIEGVIDCLTRCVAQRFKNLLTSSRYFSELKKLCLDGLVM